MSQIKLDLAQYDSEFFALAMDRVEECGNVIRDKARPKLRRAIIAAKITPNSQAGERWREHGPYAGKPEWTRRYHGEMEATVRTTRAKDPFIKNVWVIAGQFATWWATQLEYGRGKWKGGAKPFMRPALEESMTEMKAILDR